jgi:hypothetical protein
MTGEAFTVWSVRAATLLYVAALIFWLAARSPRGQRTARLAWTAGCLCYLAHVYGAFQYVHGWSHAAAYAETARQTEQLFGLNWGGGLYFNYVFTLLWPADAIWWWRGLARYNARPRWVTGAIHGFLAFMFFNGAVVFAPGFARWVGIAATPTLLLLGWRASRSRVVPTTPS